MPTTNTFYTDTQAYRKIPTKSLRLSVVTPTTVLAKVSVRYYEKYTNLTQKNKIPPIFYISGIKFMPY
jgi:hypothetical protein